MTARRPPEGPRRLRVIGRSEIVTAPIRARAAKDLGFAIDWEIIDSTSSLTRVVTRPESFDLYHQWHTVDLIWTAGSIRPIDLARLTHGAEVTAAARGRAGPSRAIDTVFDRLFVQADGRLGPAPTGRVSMLPLLHGVDSFAWLPGLRDLIGDEPESWGWLLDPRLSGRVAMIADPVLGMMEAALAVEALRGAPFADVANLSLEDLDEVAEVLLERRRMGHFRGFWSGFDENLRLVQRGVLAQSIFSPGVARLRAAGHEVRVSTPLEGSRGWHADLCISAAAEGEVLDMAYAYLNWWMNGWAGAVAARQGYYATFPTRVRQHLDPAEWDYWYDGQPAARALPDPYGQIIIPAGHRREGGSHRERMTSARLWNSFMDEHTHVARRWREILSA